MNIRIIKFYFALFPLLLSYSAFSQTSGSKLVAGLSAVFLDYQGPISGDYLQYKTFDPGIAFSAHAYLNSLMNLSINSAFVPETMYPIGGGEFLSTSLIDVNAMVQFKSNNGKIFQENTFFAPYISTGIGLNTASNNARVYVPAVLGMRFRINDNLSFNIEGAYKFSIDGKRQHIAYGGGFVFGLPSNEKPEVIVAHTQNKEKRRKNNPLVAETNIDTDGDGIPDIDDRCPEERGIITYFGCPAPGEDEMEKSTVAQTSSQPETSKDAVILKPKPIEKAFIVDHIDELDNFEQLAETPTKEDLDFLSTAMDLVHFKVASNELTTDSYQVLDKVAEIMQRYPTYKLEVSGYTDNVGQDKVNKMLSITRAFNVKRYLVYKKDIKLARIVSDGYSSANPIADNSTPSGRKKNRRVEFKLVR